ncbi:MAG: Asp-tRNA(Asn)/Glu-tRNA(Gln) amidotransferase subunit GatC [Clostridia bacterium]|nr:Asp-tRNA(Asn)/Glu-tRNA(Gln) amidotransferase subunit GatC [Clostridia bacterium]MDD4666263.1 Asp-tRNA(Asn)/Glu-tRNA(Gln) amidotransferase subunit GatC [Clostridia bacterium]
MKITVKDVEKMADLAKLELSAEESLNFEQSLQVILEQMEVLQQVETNRVEPTVYVLPAKNVFREDQVGTCLSKEEVLVNAPEVENGYFKVPRII